MSPAISAISAKAFWDNAIPVPAHGVLFVGDRGAKDRHDGVAHIVVDGAFVLVDDVGQLPENLIGQAGNLFRIETRAQACEAGDVGEEHGDLPSLALDPAGGADLLGQFTRKIALETGKHVFGAEIGA